MGFAISQLTSQMVKEVQSDCEYQLTLITNSLQRLAMDSQSILEQQMRYCSSYMANNQDEEGEVDLSTVEYMNSAVFTAKYDAQLKAIQVKEQALNVQKQQIETKQKMYSTQYEGWIKNRDKNISDSFKYGQ